MSGIKVQRDEQGRAFIDPNEIRSAMAPAHQQVQALTQVNILQQKAKQANDLVHQIVSKNPEYEQAKKMLDEARDWLNTDIVDYQREHGVRGFINTDTALDIIEELGLEADFKKLFPGVNIEDAVGCYNGRRSLQKALENTASSLRKVKVKQTVTPDKSKLGLSSSPLDIVFAGSDSDVAAIEKQLQDAERNGGVKW